MTYKNLNIYALYIILVSVAVVMSFPIFGYTTDDPGKSESEPLVIEPPPEYTIGFKSLPVEIRSRWLSLVTDQKNIEFVEFFDEGDRIISKIGETVILSGGVAPETDQGAYKLFISLQNRLVSLIDKISLNIIVSFPDMDLDSLLKENMNQRSQVSSNVIEDRKLLLASGLELIEEHRRDPMFMKYPDRTSAFAGLYFSVAELLYQESYEAFFLDTDEYINQLNILMETDPDAVASLTLPEPDYSEVLAIYQKIVDQFPSSDYSDDALYNIGFLTSEGSGKSNLKNANRIFETLLRLYPETDYKLNTLRRIGEYYFMPPVTNLEKAVEIFTRICEEYSDSEFYQEALYKLGWTYYRMDDIPASVEHFAQVLDYNFRPVDEIASTVNILDVSAESMNYIGICYSIDINQWNDAGIENMVVWLQENPERMENYGKELILQLGEIYRVQNAQFREAVAIYKKYISLFPNDHRAPEVQDYIVDIFQKGEIIDPIEAHLEKINYYDTYNPDSEWWSFNNDSKIKKEVSLKLESYLDMIIDEVLVIAIDENDQSELNKFESYSRQYLRFWPKGPNAYKIHFKLATALENNLNQPMEAVKEYWQIVNQYDDTTHREISCGRIVANVQTFVKREKNEEIWISPLGELLSPEMKEENERALEEIADSLQAIENAEIDSFAIGDSLVLTEVGIDDSLTQELELTEELVLDSLVASVDSDTTKIEPEEEIAEIEMDEETAPEPEKEDEAVKRV
ncbi:tetratricopeptide repeat protein, partial [bacterium]|nr:tetratricopeptide repeat protein [bacterium]